MFLKFKSLLTSKISDTRIKRLFVLNIFNAVGFLFLNGSVRLVLFPYLSRVLGEERFGDFLTTFSFANALTVIPGIALMTAMVRMHASYKERERSKFFRTIIIFDCLLGVTVALFFWFLMPVLNNFFSRVNLVSFRMPLVFYLYVYFMFIILGGILGSEKRYIMKSMFDACAGLLCVFLILLCYFRGIGTGVYSLFIAFGVVVISQLAACRKLLVDKPLYDNAIVMAIVKIGVFYAGCSVVNVVLQYGNRWIVGYFLNAEAVAAYYAGMSVVLMFSLAVSMAAQLETFIISQREKVSNLRYSDLKLLSVGVVALCLFLPFLAVLVGRPIMFLLYNDDLATNGMKVFNILVIILFFMPATIIVRPFIVKYCDPKVPLLFSIISAVISVGLGITLVSWIGIEGAAIATCVSAFITGILYITQFIRKIYLPVFQYAKIN